MPDNTAETAKKTAVSAYFIVLQAEPVAAYDGHDLARMNECAARFCGIIIVDAAACGIPAVERIAGSLVG